MGRWLAISWSVYTIHLPGCSEYTLSKLPETVGHGYEFEPDVCVTAHAISEDYSPRDGWGDSPVCSLVTTTLSQGNHLIGDFAITGSNTSQVPEGFEIRVMNPVTGDVGDDLNLVSSSVLAEGESGDWAAFGDDSQVGELNGCYPCGLILPFVEIRDTARASEDRCGEYLDELELCIRWADIPEPPHPTPNLEPCSPGAGIIDLYPRRKFDRDADGLAAVEMTAIQRTGHTNMVDSAWLTTVSPLYPSSIPVRIQRSNAPPTFDPSDHLTESTESTPIVAWEPTRFQVGEVHARASFLAEAVPLDDPLALAFRVEWACGIRPGLKASFESADSSPRYSLALKELGCGIEHVQRITFTPGPGLPPRHLLIGLFGSPRDAVAVPLEGGMGLSSPTFHFAQGALALSGTWHAPTGGQAAAITLEELSLDGQRICQQGRHPLSRDN